MDQYRKRFYTSIAALVAVILLFFVMVAPYRPSSVRGWALFYSMIGMIGITAILVCIEYFRWQESRSGTSGSQSDASVFKRAQARFNAVLLEPVSWGSSLIICLIVLCGAYSRYGSIPLLLVITGIFVVCFGLVKLLVFRQAQGFAFGTLAFFLGFATMIAGVYLVAPGFTPAGLGPEILANPVPLVLALFLLGIPVWSWLRVVGFSSLRPHTEADLREPCNTDLTLSHPYDRVFERCREVLTLLPNPRIDNDEPSYGLLEATVQPDQGRASTINFTVEKTGDQLTHVTISIESPVQAFTEKTGKRTYLNEKYLEIIDAYLRAAR